MSVHYFAARGSGGLEPNQPATDWLRPCVRHLPRTKRLHRQYLKVHFITVYTLRALTGGAVYQTEST